MLLHNPPIAALVLRSALGLGQPMAPQHRREGQVAQSKSQFPGSFAALLAFDPVSMLETRSRNILVPCGQSMSLKWTIRSTRLPLPACKGIHRYCTLDLPVQLIPTVKTTVTILPQLAPLY